MKRHSTTITGINHSILFIAECLNLTENIPTGGIIKQAVSSLIPCMHNESICAGDTFHQFHCYPEYKETDN